LFISLKANKRRILPVPWVIILTPQKGEDNSP
jgi:hypothetical protein